MKIKLKLKMNQMKIKLNELKIKLNELKIKLNELKTQISHNWEKTKKDFSKVVVRIEYYYLENPIPRIINYYLTKDRS